VDRHGCGGGQVGHSYAVYTGTNDSTAQLLIDQQMLQLQHNG
jgi:hypothetical protein